MTNIFNILPPGLVLLTYRQAAFFRLCLVQGDFMSDFPPIASLRSFEAVARLGSVTQAAKELHVTHSAISQQI